MSHDPDRGARELEQTQISPVTARVMVCVFLVMLVFVPLMGLIQDLVEKRRPAIVEVSKLMAQGLPKPEEIAAFEQGVEDRDWLRERLLGPSQSLLLKVGAGNERCLVGRDGWLFYTDGVDHLSGPGYLSERQQERRARATGKSTDVVKAILDFRHQLQERDIQLLVVPIPGKAALYPHQISQRYADDAAPLQHPDDRILHEQLQNEGVHILDLRSALARVRGKELAYLRTDTHWSPAGMQAAAHQIVTYLQTTGLPKGPETTSRVSVDAIHYGDLTSMLRLPKDQIDYPKEQVRAHKVLDREGDPWLPETDGSILLLGDSFSNIYSMEGLGWGTHAGLAEQIAHFSGQGVDRIAVNDGGAHSARESLAADLARGDDRLAKKKWVVWAFAERELSRGDWQLIQLPEVQDKAPIASKPLHLEGTILAAAPAPRPGSVPYADGLIALAIQPDHGKPLITYSWGLRDHKAAPAAGLSVGDRVTLKLTPWRQMRASHGGYQRNDLPQYLTLPAYWDPEPKRIGTTPEAAPPKTDSSQDTAPTVTSAQPQAEGAMIEPLSDFAAMVQAYGSDASCRAIRGKSDWLYFLPELQHLAAGPYWGDKAARASKATDPKHADPLPAIVHFQKELERHGVTLILAPIAAKASVYPEYLPETVEVPNDDQRFIQRLREQGLTVLDTAEIFRSHKDDGPPLYLKSDTHYSPRGIQLLAQHLAEYIEKESWYTAGKSYHQKTRTITLKGDLSCAHEAEETVEINRIKDGKGRRAKAPKLDPNSPVLLMGDSHTLVFHAGDDLFARGAGLPDQLAWQLGFPIDLLGVRGSGATTVRLDLMRRENPLAHTKVVIWVFTVREFTQSVQGWIKTPLP